jgi:DNA-binding IclR family transcriptional regulator
VDDKYSIQVLERAFSVMDALLHTGEALSLEAIMKHTGMAKSTAFRIVTNLVRHG